MTIYDVPVDDTEFFPVSGDMMRLMKFEEEQRTKNGTGNPAKSSPDAVDPNHYQEEQTVKNTTNDTPEVDPVKAVADLLEIVDAGLDDLEPIPDHKDDTEFRAAYRTVLDFDTYQIEVTRDDEHFITADYSIPAVPPLTEVNRQWIREAWARLILDGKVTKNRDMIFTQDLEAVFDDIEKRIFHPASCANDGKCFTRSVGAEIEHASTEEGFKAPSFNVTARFETITDQTDFRDDIYRIEKMVVDVHGPVLHRISGSVEDMRELGRFLLAQVDRIEGVLSKGAEAKA